MESKKKASKADRSGKISRLQQKVSRRQGGPGNQNQELARKGDGELGNGKMGGRVVAGCILVGQISFRRYKKKLKFHDERALSNFKIHGKLGGSRGGRH